MKKAPRIKIKYDNPPPRVKKIKFEKQHQE